jgi:hypothetical protein
LAVEVSETWKGPVVRLPGEAGVAEAGVLVAFRRAGARAGARVGLAPDLRPAVRAALERAELMDFFEAVGGAGPGAWAVTGQGSLARARAVWKSSVFLEEWLAGRGDRRPLAPGGTDEQAPELEHRVEKEKCP